MRQLRAVKLWLAFCSISLIDVSNGVSGIDWTLYQKLKTIENGIILSENLTKYVDTIHSDHIWYINDATKAKRSYDNARCISDLQRIQENVKKAKSGRFTESKNTFIIILLSSIELFYFCFSLFVWNFSAR